MKRGPPSQPTALKLVKGNPGRRPLNKREPKPRRAIPEMPDHLDAIARAEWERVVPDLYAAGVLTAIDGAVLAAYCVAYSRWSHAEHALARMKERDATTGAMVIRTKGGNLIQNPLVGVANRAMLVMTRFALEYGMTPASRTSIAAEVPANGNESPIKAESYF